MGFNMPKAMPMTPPLWQQLQACATALQSVLQGRNHTQALAPIDESLRPGAQALLFAVLRRWGRTQAVQKILVQRPPSAAANALLCTGLALALDEASAMYPTHTLVSQLVEAAKNHPNTRAQASFINACLRRFLRERLDCMNATDSLPSAKWNLPDWWIKAVRKDHPQHWEAVSEACQLAAPMVVRVNTRLTSREALQADWSAQGIDSVRVGEQGLMLRRAFPVQALPGFAQGHWSVQDVGAQLAIPLLLQGVKSQDAKAWRILDACAAPGGKTAHLLERLDAQVLALDIDALRCHRIHDNLKRLQLQAQVLVADASQPATWWDGHAFDAILLDAPCTASGIVRRHPDIPWLRRASDLVGLAKQQRQLLDALWPLLKPGGRMLYCTCSVFVQEGGDQIQAFLARNTQARLLAPPVQLIPGVASNSLGVLDNDAGEHDGFFYALLERHQDA